MACSVFGYILHVLSEPETQELFQEGLIICKQRYSITDRPFKHTIYIPTIFFAIGKFLVPGMVISGKRQQLAFANVLPEV